ncbi:hypothetical protein DAPPUDRAFT_235707 [Daphnia pulex]|uniref:Uncharacterized protein n=1 Tax=Daphnia pulex TaxID=6669 RepID=E9G0L4_DAPPU|nr:hypothetical protein DAPPUDRAFT_235707 [Daphnia pulex]|eukprot:EFX87380.1 hypothetical protein DAPPUDRAFT_235707 [Daphnia pulex]
MEKNNNNNPHVAKNLTPVARSSVEREQFQLLWMRVFNCDVTGVSADFYTAKTGGRAGANDVVVFVVERHPPLAFLRRNIIGSGAHKQQQRIQMPPTMWKHMEKLAVNTWM